MSSSTSSFEAIPKPDLKAWALGISMALVTVVAAAALSAYVDPFNSQISDNRARVDRYAEFRRDNVAQWAAFEIVRDAAEVKEGADVILLGDSRMRQLTGGYTAFRSSLVRGRKIYSLAFGGASIYEQMDYYRAFRRQFPSKKIVIIQISYDKLMQRELVSDRSRIALLQAKTPLLYLTNFDTIRRSAEWLLAGEHKPQAVGRWRSERPAKMNPLAKNCSNGRKVPTAQQMKRFYRLYRSLSREAATLIVPTVIANFVDEIRTDGAEVYFYIPPSPPQATQRLRAQYAEALGTIDDSLIQLAPVLRVDPAYSRRFAWQDAMHVCTEAGMRLLDALLIEIDAGKTSGEIPVDGRT